MLLWYIVVNRADWQKKNNGNSWLPIANEMKEFLLQCRTKHLNRKIVCDNNLLMIKLIIHVWRVIILSIIRYMWIMYIVLMSVCLSIIRVQMDVGLNRETGYFDKTCAVKPKISVTQYLIHLWWRMSSHLQTHTRHRHSANKNRC